MKLTLVANATWAAWARELDLADEIWALDPLRFNKDWNYRASWVRRARSAGFSTVIQPTYSRWTTAGDSFVRVTHAAVRIGSVGDNSNTLSWLKKWADAWYTQLIPHGGEDCMELVRNAHFMRGIGFSDFRARVPHLPVDAANLSAFQLPCPYAVLVPGGSWSGKAWPVTSFTEIGRRLLVSGLQLVIVGGAPDRRCTDELLHELDGKAINLTGRTSLAALAAILHHAQIVVSNDTGSAHIAAAVGASVVCILGGGHYGRFLPYQIEESFDKRPLPIAVSKTLACFGCNWTCIYNVEVNQPVKCIKEIMVEDVWQQIRMKLSLKAQSVETFTSTAGV
ncbi:glycosyltransferase family 9 protein [Nevskia soli]|uniref:glycosyltransferase family 9 protein n=1 Tax=Nevskia soli TaxID=418856 RepID=UPI00146FF9E7|nr:glycosyltransferase family 9 protein [Nevskia soli]